jgi:CRISPR-associated endonuclease/helicase Cas3
MQAQESLRDRQPNISCLWAKDTEYPLLDHSLDVTRVTEIVCASLPFPPAQREEIAHIGKQLAALHDVGKAASGFQDVLRGKAKRWHRHEILSAAIASQIAPEIGSEGLLAIKVKNVCPIMSCLSPNPISFARWFRNYKATGHCLKNYLTPSLGR